MVLAAQGSAERHYAMSEFVRLSVRLSVCPHTSDSRLNGSRHGNALHHKIEQCF